MGTQVNRCLNDDAMDHIDHALGRPVDPTVESYRNHFATDANSAEAKAFMASPYWDTHGSSEPSRMVYFFVTQAGRQALKQHLKHIGDKNRLYDVTFEGRTQAVVAVSAAKAKYSLWLDISDCFCDLKFTTFTRAASVRLSQTHAGGIIDRFEHAYPELYWHIAKGKISAGEPLYGAAIFTGSNTEMGHGESDESAEEAFRIAVEDAGLALSAATPEGDQ